MTAFNVVRFRVKPEGEEAFLAAHRSAKPDFDGIRRFTLFKTGDRTYCVIGEWESFDHLASARPQMVGLLDGFRHHLEDLGYGLGVTDPVSGTAVIDKMPAKRAAKPKAKK
jgi:heme-degrading monooxygenase HmoA